MRHAEAGVRRDGDGRQPRLQLQGPERGVTHRTFARRREMLRAAQKVHRAFQNHLQSSDSSKWAPAMIGQSWPIPGLIPSCTAGRRVQRAYEIAREYAPRTLSTAAADLHQNSTFKNLKSRGLPARGRVLRLVTRRAAPQERPSRRRGAPARRASPEHTRACPRAADRHDDGPHGHTCAP